MSQTTLTTFFNSRKRPATDDIVSSKAKVAHVERDVFVNGHKDLALTNSVITPVIKKQFAHISTKLDVKPIDSPVNTSTTQKTSVAFSKKESSVNVEKPKEVSKADLTNLARKDLSLGDIRKKLAGSSRLSELKATATRLSKGIQELKDRSDLRNLKEFKSINVDVPVSPSKRLLLQNELSPKKKSESITKSSEQKPIISPRKVVVSPIKSPNKVPAYIRHASLITNSTTLPLPHHYRFLAELFRGMETVVALLFNRNEKITFSKLKPSIQEMLKRNFTEKHLAQIKNLVPDFYNYEVQKIKTFSNTSHKESYELVISPNFPNDIKNMNPTVLLERRRYFYDTLLQSVKKHHSQYLASLDPPMYIPDEKLVRWHPEFELEKIPEIEGAKLPEVPNLEKFSSAQDVLAKARELFKCNTKMGRALEKLAEAKTKGLTEEEKKVTGLVNNTDNVATQTIQPSVSNVTILNPALRNLPPALLEKVKAKQAAKALMAMTRSSENEQKYLTYNRLPDLARTLRNIFVTERKNVLALNIVLSKLDNSFKSHVTSNELQRDIKILSEDAPNWIKLHEIRNATYVKLDKNIDLKKIISMLEDKAKTFKTE